MKTNKEEVWVIYYEGKRDKSHKPHRKLRYAKSSISTRLYWNKNKYEEKLKYEIKRYVPAKDGHFKYSKKEMLIEAMKNER